MDRFKLTVLGAAAAAAALTFAAPAAADTSVTLSFNHAVLDTPATDDAQIVSPSTAPLTMTADVADDGTFTVQPSDFSAPTYTTTTPVNATATVVLAQPASGTIDPSTGALSMTADFLATLTVPGYGSCTYNTGNLTLNTATTGPLTGVPFPATPTGYQTGAGAFGTSWSTLPPGTGTLCGEINGYVDGPGGLWISRNISVAQAQALVKPKLALKVTKPASLPSGGSEKVSMTLTNTGAADTKSVKVCLISPNSDDLTPARACKTVAKPRANSVTKLSFTVKAATFASNSVKVGRGRTFDLTVTATGLRTQKVPVKVVFSGNVF